MTYRVLGLTVVVEQGGGNCYGQLIDGDNTPIAYAMESMILAHACAGIDVGSKAYVQGVQTAIDAVSNHC